MAIGDAAAQAGLHTAPDTQAVGKGAENHNRRGDELAAEKTARVAADTQLTANLSNLNNFVQAINNVLVTKADGAAVTAALGGKADKTAVTDSLATKADGAAVTAALGGKADKTAVTASLATKADGAAVTAALGGKVDNSRIRIQGNQPETIAGVSGRIWFQPV